MIDLHSHLLPGIDDGARDLEASVAMARAMVADGVRVVAATPHVRDDYPTTPEAMEQALEAVRSALAGAGVALEVVGGGELALDRLGALERATRARFTLGGSRALLLESPTFGWPFDLPHVVAGLCRDGLRPVLAHPERNRDVHEDLALVGRAVEAGALVQLTAASVDGRNGRETAACARALVEAGLAHLVSSDAHGPGVRAAGLSAAVRRLGDEPLGRWLVEEVPAALLADADLPPRPAARRRFSLRRR